MRAEGCRNIIRKSSDERGNENGRKKSTDNRYDDLRSENRFRWKTLQSYEKNLLFPAMTVFITERTQELFHRYPVDLDAMAVEKLDENVRLVEQNGVY